MQGVLLSLALFLPRSLSLGVPSTPTPTSESYPGYVCNSFTRDWIATEKRQVSLKSENGPPWKQNERMWNRPPLCTRITWNWPRTLRTGGPHRSWSVWACRRNGPSAEPHHSPLPPSGLAGPHNAWTTNRWGGGGGAASSSISNIRRRYLHLTPREVNHLQLHQAGRLAQYRLARGIRLNHPEAVALLTMQLMEEIRRGAMSVADLMEWGSTLLGTLQVLPGIPALIPQVQVEATFPDGTKLLTLHDPIVQRHGNLQAALEGSFLPVPDVSLFLPDPDETTTNNTNNNNHWSPGQVTVSTESPDIVLNAGRELVEVAVTNTGDRPIQVGSHYAFVETNRMLSFDRQVAIGKRLNIPAGTSVRFEPGEVKPVTLVALGGQQIVHSGNGLTQGPATTERHEEIMQRVKDQGFLHQPTTTIVPGRAYVMDRLSYADMYGPTVGDKIALGDTQLEIQVEQDHTVYGDECKFGGGKTIREGMGQQTSVGPDVALDVVITNALIVDAVTGIVKADIGIRGNRIVGIGKAGNPDTMDGVLPNDNDTPLIVGATTEVIAGEKLIVTAGGVDTHIHWICPQQIEEAVASGVTTMFGGGTGPVCARLS